MTDYTPAFGALRGRFVTLGEAIREADSGTLAAIDRVARILEREAEENLAHDHFHPEIAGPLQQGLYFLQLIREGVKR